MASARVWGGRKGFQHAEEWFGLWAIGVQVPRFQDFLMWLQGLGSLGFGVSGLGLLGFRLTGLLRGRSSGIRGLVSRR